LHPVLQPGRGYLASRAALPLRQRVKQQSTHCALAAGPSQLQEVTNETNNRRRELARAGGYPDGLGGLCHILAGEGEQMTYKGNDHGTY